MNPAPDITTEWKHQLYREGDLSWKVLPHRIDHYERFRRWNVVRQTREHHDWCKEIGARFDRLWVDRSSRKTAKTGTWLIIAVETCIRYFLEHGVGADGLFAIPVQKKIGGVLVPISKEIFRDAPEGYAPVYRGSGNGEHEHFYVPAVNGRMKLVGLDHHPDALRGPHLDFGVITEAGFVKNLESTVMSELWSQFHGRPWAWIAMESSEPKQKDHDFNVTFRPDAELRGAFTEMVITDNTRLTAEEIEDEIRAMGGRDNSECKRELFNINEPDPDMMIVPEFDEDVHVVDPADWPVPQYALAHEGMDPGITDPFGHVGGYLDWERQCFVVQFAWQQPNASTGDVVARVRSLEADFWGTEHERPETRGPNQPLQRIAGAQTTGAGKVWTPPEGALTYWDEGSWTLRPNPFSRISDVHNRFILDMNRDYALQVRAAEKEPGSAEEDLQYLRLLFAARHESGAPKIVILNNGHTVPLIQQLRSGMWNTKEDWHRTDWLRSKVLGHCDCLAALKYVLRDLKWRRNPKPPAFRDINAPNTWVPPKMLEKMRGAGAPIGMPAMFGNRAPMRLHSQWRPR